jgi:tetratricopeptide (TPR) repeat protein
MDQKIDIRGSSISTALDAAAGILTSDAEQAATEASEVLDMVPGQPQALLLLISALKVIGAGEGACGLLKGMAEEYPNLASVYYELGILLARYGKSAEATESLSRALALEPNHPLAWRALGDELARAGDREGASKAYARHIRSSLRELKLLEDAMEGGTDALAKAERLLHQAVSINPTDVLATRMLGVHYLTVGRLREAEATLKRALELAPGCWVTRSDYGVALTQQANWKGAQAQLEILLEQDPGNAGLEALQVSNLIMLGEREEARRVFEKVRANASGHWDFWLNFGHAARSVGENDDVMIQAYRKAVELEPGFGTAWWALADLKTYRFTPSEIATMREQLKRNDLADGQRCHLEFALGRALEDEGGYSESFEHYREGNKLRRPYVHYDADGIHMDIMRTKAFFTGEFFSTRKNMGCPSPDPIFIVGMPRAGSTLVEQILSSHSQVEGTMELPDMSDIIRELIQQHPGKDFPALLSEVDLADLRKLGEDYLERTRYQRKLNRPFFTDKAGNNFASVGFIHVILPNAKIIDARRHPIACGFSCYKQAFAPGAIHFAYDQAEIGRYYRDYVDLMARYDEVMPGRVHRVLHEELVRDPEREIRRLLAYCDLPFEEQCLRFYETDRSVRTSSSQQVRQPIQKKKVEVWQHYESWLQPMKDVLGDVLTSYPEAPNFD